MNYIDEIYLTTYIEESLLNEITTEADDEGLTNVSRAIRNRCSFVDSMLSDRYDTPFQDGSKYITESLKMNIAHLVLFDLLPFISSISESEMNIRKTNYNAALTFFSDIRNGKVSLVSESNPKTGEKIERFYFGSTRRINGFH